MLKDVNANQLLTISDFKSDTVQLRDAGSESIDLYGKALHLFFIP